MTDIHPVSRIQRILVEPASQTVSVVSIGKQGPAGPEGPQGEQGPQGPPGIMAIRTGTSFPDPYDGEPVFNTFYNRPFRYSAAYTEWMPDFVNKKTLRTYGLAGSSTNSTSYVDWPVGGALSFTFRKFATATDLIISLGISGYISAGGSSFINYGFRLNAVDHGIMTFGQPGINVRIPMFKEKAVLSHPAGDITVCCRFAVTNAAVTYRSDTNDALSLSVEEVWPQSPAQ